VLGLHRAGATIPDRHQLRPSLLPGSQQNCYGQSKRNKRRQLPPNTRAQTYPAITRYLHPYIVEASIRSGYPSVSLFTRASLETLRYRMACPCVHPIDPSPLQFQATDSFTIISNFEAVQRQPIWEQFCTELCIKHSNNQPPRVSRPRHRSESFSPAHFAYRLRFVSPPLPVWPLFWLLLVVATSIAQL
jgi:hypothetical protein